MEGTIVTEPLSYREPFQADEFVDVNHGRAGFELQPITKTRAASKPARSVGTFHGFVGSSVAMQAVYRAIEQVADSNASIFLSGESGTGKEVGALAIHAQSKRAKAPFIAINCAAIPENLLESELFGHLKGSFTGATADRLGAVREANGGTLFLDEICEMDLKLQVKLLRFLQTQTIQPVGSAKTIAVDVRIICATNRDVVCEVAEGRFRKDLYYRLAVIPLNLPPLRERERDVLELTDVFMTRYSTEEGKVFSGVSEAAKAALLAYQWPGNVRELQNRVRRGVILNAGGIVGPEMLGLDRPAAAPLPSPSYDAGMDMMAMLDRMSLDEVEQLVIMRAIDRHASNVTTAATDLGVSPSTLYRKLERWKIAS
jgi:two-component system, repressor protein LuxO